MFIITFVWLLLFIFLWIIIKTIYCKRHEIDKMHNAAALEAYFDKNNYFGLHVTTNTMTEDLLTAIIYTYIVFNYQNLIISSYLT